MDKKIRFIYLELQGFLKELPALNSDKSAIIRDSGVWESYHQKISDLNALTGNDYNNSKVCIKNTQDGFRDPYYISLTELRFKLAGIISRLYAEFFSDERNPLDGSPTTLINNSQNQNQSLQIEIALEISDLISNKIDKFEDGSKEKTFLEQVKNSLKSGKGVVDLISSILKTGSQIGLTTAEILKLFT